MSYIEYKGKKYKPEDFDINGNLYSDAEPIDKEVVFTIDNSNLPSLYPFKTAYQTTQKEEIFFRCSCGADTKLTEINSGTNMSYMLNNSGCSIGFSCISCGNSVSLNRK